MNYTKTSIIILFATLVLYNLKNALDKFQDGGGINSADVEEDQLVGTHDAVKDFVNYILQLQSDKMYLTQNKEIQELIRWHGNNLFEHADTDKASIAFFDTKHSANNIYKKYFFSPDYKMANFDKKIFLLILKFWFFL
jgi:predicted Zn-dependent protease